MSHIIYDLCDWLIAEKRTLLRHFHLTGNHIRPIEVMCISVNAKHLYNIRTVLDQRIFLGYLPFIEDQHQFQSASVCHLQIKGRYLFLLENRRYLPLFLEGRYYIQYHKSTHNVMHEYERLASSSVGQALADHESIRFFK